MNHTVLGKCTAPSLVLAAALFVCIVLVEVNERW